MSLLHHNQRPPNATPSRAAPPQAAAPLQVSPKINASAPTPDSPPASLAHELANLLDGSLRQLGLAVSTLRRQTGEAAQDDSALRRLETATESLHDMAALLQRWINSSREPDSLHRRPHTLGETVERAVRLVAPAAASRRIELRVTVEPEAAALPGGPLYPVLLNALRNSIEAIAAAHADGAGAPRQIEISAAVEGKHLCLRVRDDGPGLDPRMTDETGDVRIGATTKPFGHGLGLSLVRDIAATLRGSFTLTNRPEGGAELALRVPCASLQPAAHAG